MSGALWHGFADMGRYSATALSSSPGVRAPTSGTMAGTRYLDATAGLWFTNVGHGRTEIADAVAAQLSKVAHFSNFGDFTSDTTVALASGSVRSHRCPDRRCSSRRVARTPSTRPPSSPGGTGTRWAVPGRS